MIERYIRGAEAEKRIMDGRKYPIEESDDFANGWNEAIKFAHGVIIDLYEKAPSIKGYVPASLKYNSSFGSWQCSRCKTLLKEFNDKAQIKFCYNCGADFQSDK